MAGRFLCISAMGLALVSQFASAVREAESDVDRIIDKEMKAGLTHEKHLGLKTSKKAKVLTTQAAALDDFNEHTLVHVTAVRGGGAKAQDDSRKGSDETVPTGTIGWVSAATGLQKEASSNAARVVKVLFGSPYNLEAIVMTGDIEELTECANVKFFPDQWRSSQGYSEGSQVYTRSGYNNEYLPEDQDLRETMMKGETFKIDAFWQEDGQWGADMCLCTLEKCSEEKCSDSGKSDSVLIMYGGNGFMQVV